MYPNKRFAWTALCLSVLLFAACEDPSNVGEDLVGGLEGQPETEAILVDSFALATGDRDVTGGANRVLAGRVDDPTLGVITANAHVDFSLAGNIGAGFRDTAVTSAQLLLYRNYTYGDTTASVTLRLYEQEQELNYVGLRADTTIQPGTFLTEFTVRHQDTLVTVNLPQEWVRTNSDTLTSTGFTARFHGFSITGEGNQAVFGFSAAQPRSNTPGILLRVVGGRAASRVTVDYPVAGRATTISRLGSPPAPPDHILLQDGIQSAIHLDFDYVGDQGLENTAAVNRAVLALTTDPSLLTTPANFYRPPLRIILYAEYPPDDPLAFFQQRNGRYLSVPVDARQDRLATIVQRVFLGGTEPRRYRVEAIESENTINAAYFYTPDVADPDTLLRPQARLTITPTL